MKTTFNTPAGVCRFCGCSEYDACEEGCYWADRTFRLCSTCVPAARAEGKHVRAVRRAGYRIDAAWLRAYHAGFIVGWFAVTPRSPYGRNPHETRVLQSAWAMGQRAGATARHGYTTTIGPVNAVPRRAILVGGHAGSARSRRVVVGRGHGARDRRAWSRA